MSKLLFKSYYLILCPAIGLPKRRTEMTTGIANSESTLPSHSVDVTIGRIQFSASVLSKMTKDLPNGLIDTTKLTRTRNLRMADPNYYKPSKIDILLGTDISEQLMLCGKLEERQIILA